MLKRAYSLLEIKAFDEDKRELTGVATTPTPDRYGDVVEPKGAQFKLPLPFLWQHDASQPIGHVTKAKPSKDGIEVTVKLVKTDEPGILRDRLEEAWQSIKLGLVRGLSIGFRSIEHSFIDGTNGIHFKVWDWLELSAVTIPANAEASIQAIKSIDRSVRAALGREDGGSSLPGASGIRKSAASAVRIHKPGVPEMSKKTYAEQITHLQATRDAKASRMEEIVEKCAEEGRTKDASEQEEFDTLKGEVDKIDREIKDLRDMEQLSAQRSRPAVEDAKSVANQVASYEPRSVSVRSAEQSLEKGIGFARYARCKLLSQLDRAPITQVAKHLYPGDERLMTVLRDGVAAANTLNSGWAGNLINEGGIAFADFVEYLRPRTILGQIEGRLRRLPFDTPVLIQSTGATGGWVKEGDSKPVTKWSYSRDKLAPLTVAAIAAATRQQLMRASADADRLLRDELARAVGDTLNQTFADPSIPASQDESPGSIFNGVSPLIAHGDTGVFGVRCDIEKMLQEHNDANLEFDGLFWIMSGRNAIALSQMANEIGGPAFPTVTPTGGTLAGFPVVVSNYAPTESDGSLVALVKGSEIYFADEGGIDVSVSDQASLVMDTAPTMEARTPTGVNTSTQALVSLWQTNSVAFRVERFINWKRRRAEAVAWMMVNWTACQTQS